MKTEIEIENLEKIADYYEFPLAVFFSDFSQKDYLVGTRKTNKVKRLQEIKEQIIELLDEL